MKWVACLFISVLTSQLAHSQINSGSILIFQLAHDKFLMAADSRMMLEGKASDGNCKIAAFGDHLVFGVTASPKYIPLVVDLAPAWDAMKEVKNAITLTALSQGNSAARVIAIADTWARHMHFNWQNLFSIHPELVRKVAEDDNGGLTEGVFAAGGNGDIALTARRINFTNDIITIEYADFISTCGVAICASGMLDIFTEYTKKTSQRAKDESWTFPPSLLGRTSPEMLRIVRLVDLAIAYDQSGTVGGSIDAVELDADGSIHWFQNPNCPETYQ
ncbi:MAG: hypothetical protein WA239_20625 [Candidatus Sulfotelmatobacter sp.]